MYNASFFLHPAFPLLVPYLLFSPLTSTTNIPLSPSPPPPSQSPEIPTRCACVALAHMKCPASPPPPPTLQEENIVSHAPLIGRAGVTWDAADWLCARMCRPT
jgi:hypothetical protein